ncbi:flagellar basal body rod protein FlgG [Clostridium tagluense]|uniref:flagellar hook-basal body complex protein n=1 Tax=Clostridium tagluense TaxID=360422 RepID=UPI001C0D3285|nr:flagellar hook-basal body complex protein [Clostridium tagluense]MBU3126625.1 flagellar basal body rod protein FlgG [Clostridium tagluense]MCB2309993.1 flagellar basal body rod protein FlgG [Clostridium tagluense]MCB2314477.1 flagellar basal body rod protein FlgG [Clostridium tagluense]MCB2319325.1 flagellar basal body rod protein FlgG [Clostridium tagluense]MCB2324587.1 flagellar basal body rod protein FlgG [Clostridium tagluense]
MIRGLYTAVTGLITGEAKQSIVANNLANANTNGFKSENLSIKKFDDVLIQNYDKIVNGKNTKNTIGSLSMGSRIDDINTEFTQGLIQTTDKSTDFAIEGKGFFTVQRNDGINNKDYYTRSGNFHVDGQGYLVTDSGDKVLCKNKATNAVQPLFVGEAKLKADKYGNISVNGENLYKLNTVDFADYKTLKKVGDNLFEGVNPLQNQNITVRQNALEKSNVNITNEMINMMTILRNFESNQKVLQAMDETLGKAVNDVGTVR